MRRYAKNFYVGIYFLNTYSNQTGQQQIIPKLTNLIYTENPNEYNMKFYPYFYEKERIIIIKDNEYQELTLKKGENVNISNATPIDIEILFLNFEHFYITHSPNNAGVNIILTPEASEQSFSRATPFLIQNQPPSITKIIIYGASNLTIHNSNTLLSINYLPRERSILKYLNLDENRYEIINVSEIIYDE